MLSVYVNATAVVFGAHVAASAARLPDRAARDRAIEDERAQFHVPFRRWLVAYLRGLWSEPRANP